MEEEHAVDGIDKDREDQTNAKKNEIETPEKDQVRLQKKFEKIRVLRNDLTNCSFVEQKRTLLLHWTG